MRDTVRLRDRGLWTPPSAVRQRYHVVPRLSAEIEKMREAAGLSLEDFLQGTRDRRRADGAAVSVPLLRRFFDADALLAGSASPEGRPFPGCGWPLFAVEHVVGAVVARLSPHGEAVLAQEGRWGSRRIRGRPAGL